MELHSFTMSGQFSTHIIISLFGLVILFPYVFWELWRFIKPALYVKETKIVRGVVFFTSVSYFLLGVLFGYYLVVPLSVNFLGSYQVSEYVSNTIGLSSFIFNCNID